MISTNLQHINELLPYVSLRLGIALVYLRDTDFSQLATGEYEISGRKVFARVNTYDTEPQELKKPEAHGEYIDVQFLVAGTERIGYCPVKPEYRVSEDCLAEKDVAFYEQVTHENYLTLEAGDIGVFFPWEIHRPGCAVGPNSTQVTKVVVKVKIGG
ncbi:MAG: YhcH/YjgK/YiaL family protein [Acidaminococcaceae bacterium]